MSEAENKKTFFAQWLEKLQQESWQLELLISGLALFGLWEARGLVDQLDQQLDGAGTYQGIIGSMIGLGMLVLKSGLQIILVNFLIHVTLRALWIGAIGLRYVSGDIDYDKLGYSDIFKDYYRKRIGSFDDYIERLENWCSVIFAYTFLAVGLFASFMLYVVWYILLIVLIQSFGGGLQEMGIWTAIASLIYLGIGFFVFIDFISLGVIRKIEDRSVARVFLWIYRVFGIMTLSFIYRPILLNFLDQKFTRRLFFLSVPYVAFLLLVFPPLEVVSFGHFSESQMDIGINAHNYDDLRLAEEANALKQPAERMPINYFSLGSSIEDGPYGTVFFSMKASDTKYLEEVRKIQPFQKAGIRHDIFAKGMLEDTLNTAELDNFDRQIRVAGDEFRAWMRREGKSDSLGTRRMYRKRIDSLRLERQNLASNINRKKYKDICDGILELILIEIDSVDYKDSLSCKFFVHPNLGEKGLLCFYPTSGLDQGEHTMFIRRNTYTTTEPDSLRTLRWWVPFWTN